jgi:putative thioredoxin
LAIGFAFPHIAIYDNQLAHDRVSFIIWRDVLASMGLTTDEQKAVEAFRSEVVAPSMEGLVVLDFWAEWCGPCKQLTPILEKTCANYADKGVVLVKINVDENAFIAAQFQVQSIPTVYAVYQGQPVADLSSARTEPQLAQMLDQLLDKLQIQPKGVDSIADVEPLVAAGEELMGAKGEAQALELFSDALEQVPNHPGALSGVIRALITLNRRDEAQAIHAELDAELQASPILARAKTMLDLTADALDDDGVAALKAQLATDPDNMQTQFDLANAYIASGERDEAADQLLAMIAADREWSEGAARTRLLELFAMIGLEDPWVAATRRRLSAILFG